jgi:hypothetical protein
MKALSQFLAVALLTGATTAPLAGHAASIPESEAIIARPDATRTALSAVKGGTVQDVELEREHDRIIWSFDIARPGSDGITEVQIDAVSGRIISRKNESRAAEASEAKSEAAAHGRAETADPRPAKLGGR